MLFRTHMVFAILVFLFSYKFFSDIFLFGLFLVFATLFVDIDTRESKMGKIFIFRPIQMVFSHRGFFHSLSFGILFSILFFFLNKSAGFGFFIGFMLHLFLDCLTVSGIALFFPFSKKRIRGFFKTSGLVEEILFVLVFSIDLFLVGKIVFNTIF